MKMSKGLAEGDAMSGILEAVSFRRFWSEDEIKDLVARHMRETENAFYPTLSGPRHDVDPSALRALLIFSTSKQQTWLVADRQSIHCVLDDRRREEPAVRWSLSGEMATPIVARNHSKDSGLLDVGPRKDWLFSKRLFRETDIVASSKRLVDYASH